MINIQQENFNIQYEIDQLTAGRQDIGAISSFIGLVRDFNHQSQDSQAKKVQSLYLEHYPAMTKKTLEEIASKATMQWDLQACRIIHRIGHLSPADNIVLVICCAPKRISTLNACEYVIHSLKVNAPFWKKEYYTNGTEKWVEQLTQDKQLADNIS